VLSILPAWTLSSVNELSPYGSEFPAAEATPVTSFPSLPRINLSLFIAVAYEVTYIPPWNRLFKIQRGCLTHASAKFLASLIRMPYMTLNPLQKATVAGLSLLALGVFCTAGLLAPGDGARSGEGTPSSSLPLSFEPNRGQSEDGVQFVARGPGYALYLNEDGPSFQFSSATETSEPRTELSLALKLAGVRKSKAIMLGLDEQPSKSSYYSGSDPKKWVTDIPNFSRVERRGAYEGVDVSYHGSQGQLECEFKVAPRANPGAIALKIMGGRNLRLSTRGDIVFTVADVEMRLHRPTAQQEVKGARQAVASHYRLKGNLIYIVVGAYDAATTLIIDPILSYSGFLKLQDANSFPAAPSFAVESFATELDSSKRTTSSSAIHRSVIQQSVTQPSFTKHLQEQYAISNSH
jgi:predicted DNA-binding protein (UPF0251 family)